MHRLGLAPLLIVVIPMAASVASAEGPALHPHESMNNWGTWGADDERGAVNYITPERIVAASKLIKSGKMFSLAIPIAADGPVFPPRQPPLHTMLATGADFVADPGFSPFGPSPMRFADDHISMPLQGSTQWDALSHAWYGDELYNGVSQAAIRSAPAAGGATKLGIQHWKESLIGRGVLVDVVAYKGGTLPPGYPITRADVEGALEKQGTKVQTGDIVIFRTGWVPGWYALETPTQRVEYIAAPHTGITSDVVPWIHEHRIAAVAADSLALERLPNDIDPSLVVPLHGNLLRDLGVAIGEIWWLEELAADCAKDGRYEFFLAAQPLNIPGAVGSPLNPVAIK
jgi:kynurenine formamidase